MSTVKSTGTTGTGTGSTADTGVGQQTGTESSLSNWAGPYVTDMLGPKVKHWPTKTTKPTAAP